ncbi:MAG: MATE family efflux transporter [bacterium]|nr:MATE family efflux transporter [bacterium]
MAWKAKRISAGVDVNSITGGVIWKTLLAFFFPILLGTFFQQMYNTVDAIIVGKFVGKEALAAVGGATGSLINLIVGFFVGLSSGATVILSQFYGGRRSEEVSQTVHTAMAMAITGGAIIMIVGYIFSPALLEMLGTPADVLPHAVIYLRIYFIGMIPSLIYNIGSGLLRAVGDSRRPLLFLAAACIVNIVLDVLLVVGMELGAAGAALATILSQLVSAVLVIFTLTSSPTVYHLDVRKIRFHTQLLGRIAAIGLPAGLQSMMYSVSNVVIQTAVNGFGTDMIAAYTAFGKLDGFYWMIVGAFGVSITTFVGQNFGAKQYDRMRRSVRVCLLMMFGSTIVLSTLLLLGGRMLYHLFTDDPVVIEYGLQMLRVIAPAYMAFICIEILSGALRGVGDSLVATLFTLFGVCVFRVIWVVWILPMNHTLEMLMLSYPITWTLTSILFIVYYLWGGWLKRAIRKSGLA